MQEKKTLALGPFGYKKKPAKKKVLALALGMGLTVEEAQAL